MAELMTITIVDRASSGLAKLQADFSPAAAAAHVGPFVRQTVRSHLARNPRNEKGWPSTGFWEGAARGTDWQADGDTVTIRINKIGVRQRIYGGEIRAVRAKFLTIPISSQAYGKTVADFPGAFLIHTPKGAYIAQYAGGNTAKGRFKKQRATLEFLFKLQRSVKQEGNRQLVPSESNLTAVAIAALKARFTKSQGAE